MIDDVTTLPPPPPPRDPAAEVRDRTGPMQILVNALSGAGARVATMIVGFSLTPYIIHSLGIAQYGLYSVVAALPAYLGLLDFGLGGAWIKFITEFVERGDRGSARQVVTFGVLFYLAFGLVLAVPVAFGAPWLVHLFKMPESQMPAAIRLFYVNFAILIFTWAANVPGMTVVAMQRMDLASRNDVIGYAVYAVATFLLLHAGYGINGLIAASALQIVLITSLQYATGRRLFGPLWHKSPRYDRALIGRLFGFGGWTQANSILDAVNVDAGRFIAAGIVSVASVGFYEIGSKLSWFTKMMPAYLLNALMPAAAAFDARGDAGALRRMYATATRYNVFLSLGCGGFIIGGADAIVRVWLGQSLPYVSAIILWLGLGYAVYSVSGVGTTILRASGRPRYETYYSAVSTGVNVLATWPLAHAYGIVGVAMGSAAGWFAGTAYFTIVFHRIADHGSWWGLVGSTTVRLFAAAGLAGFAVARVEHLPLVSSLCGNRLTGVVVLVALGAGFSFVYAALTWILGVWKDDHEHLARRAGELVRRLTARRRFADGRG